MMKIWTKLFLISASLLVVGCMALSKSIDVSERESISSPKKLKLQGYYAHNYLPKESTVKTFIFFTNNSVYEMELPSCAATDLSDPNKYVERCHNNYVAQLNQAFKSWNMKSKWNSDGWGKFYIDADTIRIQYYVNSGTKGLFAPVVLFNLIEERGLIMNDSTFVLKRKTFYGDEDIVEDIDETYYFRSMEAKPDSTNWVDNKYF